MKKDDKGKRRWTLLDWGALAEAVDVLEAGSAKYGDGNWRQCDDVGRFVNALFRHLTAYASGEIVDSESGMPHMAHVLCNAMFVLSLERENATKADRPEKA